MDGSATAMPLDEGAEEGRDIKPGGRDACTRHFRVQTVQNARTGGPRTPFAQTALRSAIGVSLSRPWSNRDGRAAARLGNRAKCSFYLPQGTIARLFP